jgi:hypothetical protein
MKTSRSGLEVQRTKESRRRTDGGGVPAYQVQVDLGTQYRFCKPRLKRGYTDVVQTAISRTRLEEEKGPLEKVRRS